jgi:hypothetical protein
VLTSYGEANCSTPRPRLFGPSMMILFLLRSFIYFNKIYFFDFSSIFCLIQTSDNVNEIDENCNPTPLFSVSEQLKKVKIEWYRKDELVEKIVRILFTYGVPRGHIDIEQILDLPQGKLSVTLHTKNVYIFIIFNIFHN